jgi:hypothetical protein
MKLMRSNQMEQMPNFGLAALQDLGSTISQQIDLKKKSHNDKFYA